MSDWINIPNGVIFRAFDEHETETTVTEFS